MSYVDRYSWRGFLGPQSRNITYMDTYAYWKTYRATNVVFFSNFKEFDDLEKLLPFTTYYINEDLYGEFKDRYKFNHKRTKSIIINIDKLSISGRKMRDVRWAVNNINKKNITIESNYRKIDDVVEFVREWKDFIGVKYFQDRSSKNIYFFKNTYHKDCINIFCYDGDKLISFGVLSPPESGYSSYVLGKSLYHKYKGLSEFTDVMLFRAGLKNNIKNVDMGDGGKELLFYKNKFLYSEERIFYHGKVSKQQVTI